MTYRIRICIKKTYVSPGDSFTHYELRTTDLQYCELWCWRKLLRVPWTARRANQSIPKEISPGCSLEGLMLKLKLQYFGHLMRRTDSLEKTPMFGKIEGRRRRGRQRTRRLAVISASMDISLSKLWAGDGQGGLACCTPWGRKQLDTTERLNWFTIQKTNMACLFFSPCIINEIRDSTL